MTSFSRKKRIVILESNNLDKIQENKNEKQIKPYDQTFLIKTFAVLMIIGMMDSPAFSQTRIRFARGRTSATVSGTLYSGGERSYILGARRGQTMTVRVTSAQDVRIDIGGNDVGTAETIELRSTDDYIITVHNEATEERNILCMFRFVDFLTLNLN